jgi:hypothetical protein
MLSGERFFTLKRFKFFLKRVLFPLAVIYAGLFLVAAVRDYRVKNNEYAAVLLSDHALWEYDYWASPCAFLGSYIPWTNYFSNRNLKVRWFFRAKMADMEKVIKDPLCHSIILVGHGSANGWQATDEYVSNNEVAVMTKGLPKKKGEWLQLSCGDEDFTPVLMGELVMERSRVYTYGKQVGTYSFVVDALTGFRHLKGLKDK